MFKSLANSDHLALSIIGWSFAGLVLLLLVAPLQYLIIVLNAIYAGSMFGIIIAYWGLIKATIAGAPPFDRARQYALGVFTLWTAYNIGVAVSIWTRTIGQEPPVYLLVAASRYVAIIAAWLQVTAPDFGSGFFSSRDRKVLWVAVSISIIVSAALIVAQDRTILSN